MILRPSGVTPKAFFEEYWEKKPLLIYEEETNGANQNRAKEENKSDLYRTRFDSLHQASTASRRSGNGGGGGLLHLTVSMMQKWSWVDLLEVVLSDMLEAVAESETTTMLRIGLPRGFLDYMEMIHEENEGDVPEGLHQIAHRIEDDNDTEGETDGKSRKEERKKQLQK